MIIASILVRTTLRTGQFCREHFGESEEIAALSGFVTEDRDRDYLSTFTTRIGNPTIVGKGI